MDTVPGTLSKNSVTVREVSNGVIVMHSYNTKETDKEGREYVKWNDEEFVFTDKAEAFVKAAELLA